MKKGKTKLTIITTVLLTSAGLALINGNVHARQPIIEITPDEVILVPTSDDNLAFEEEERFGDNTILQNYSFDPILSVPLTVNVNTNDMLSIAFTGVTTQNYSLGYDVHVSCSNGQGSNFVSYNFPTNTVDPVFNIQSNLSCAAGNTLRVNLTTGGWKPLMATGPVGDHQYTVTMPSQSVSGLLHIN